MIGEIFQVTSWRDFMKKVCEFLYEYDAQVFRSLAKHNDFKGKSIRIIDDNASNMRSPLKIAEGLYIETNRSAKKPEIHDNRTTNVRLYQGLKAYERIYSR